MKSFFNPSFDYIPSAESAIHDNFERVWRELGEREDSEAYCDDDRDSIRLECTGELVDAASVDAVPVCKSALGVQIVEFVCPRCNEHHESLSFR